MFDVDTFLTTLYVIADDFCHSQPPKKRPGPQASLSRSEVLTLATFARWSRFNSERDFYRYAHTKVRNAFPTLPDRSQFNRLVRSCTELIEAFALHLVSLLTDARSKHPYPKLWTARLCPSGIASVAGMDGASTADQQMAETFFCVRAQPNPKLISVGSACLGPYVADKGFEGEENHRRWLDL